MKKQTRNTKNFTVSAPLDLAERIIKIDKKNPHLPGLISRIFCFSAKVTIDLIEKHDVSILFKGEK